MSLLPEETLSFYKDMLLKDKVALVTGAATGIGEAVARLFAGHGARLFLMDRDAPGVEAVAASIGSTGASAQPFAGDVRQTADLARVVEAAVREFGRFDVLINNAGIYPRARFLEITDQQWDEMQDINLKSMFHSMQLALPHMIAQRSGKIVNISSVTFHMGMDTLTHYVASKGGVIGLTRSVAREMGEHNIHVNCITPGAIKTEAEARVVTEEQAKGFLSRQSLQRRLMPLDVARVCLFLSSELSDGMTGQCLNVDAGWVMY
jgi:3-oxoacyl-[acyl-carrier protein] reductase